VVGKKYSFGVVAFAAVVSVVFALSSANSAAAYTATEYSSATNWSIGMVASVNSNGEPVPASLEASNYIGVVTQVSARKSVEVAGTGIVTVMVTDKDGSIGSGTRLGISAVSGVASAWSGGTIIGVVQETPTKWSTVELEDNSSAKVALVKTQLLSDGSSEGGSVVSQFFSALEKTASGVAGKPVDTWRVITALLIGLGGLVLAFGLLFVSSRESFFAMGRNPMAGKVIMRGLWKMVFLSVGILCVTLTAAYLIVRIS